MEEQGLLVAPLVGSPAPKVDQASAEMVASHARSWPEERILLQKHAVHALPVTHVSGRWKDKQFGYHVYGQDLAVHAPEYPQGGCCGCCTLL